MAHLPVTAMAFAQKFEPFPILLTFFPRCDHPQTTKAPSSPDQSSIKAPEAPAPRGPTRLTKRKQVPPIQVSSTGKANLPQIETQEVRRQKDEAWNFVPSTARLGRTPALKPITAISSIKKAAEPKPHCLLQLKQAQLSSIGRACGW